MNKVYTIENIDCANCAAKIERLIGNLPQVEDAVINFTTKQLRVTATEPDELVEEMTRLANTVENGVVIKEKSRSNIKSVQAKSMSKKACGTEDCNCGHCHKGTEPCEEGHCHESHIGAESLPKTKGIAFKLTSLHGIVTGAFLFAVGIVLENLMVSQLWAIALFVGAYVILGGEILAKAVRNIGKGQIFDENFLMSIATLGAFAIQEYPEAVGVMLFFRIGEYFEEKAVEKSRSQIMDAVDLRPEVVSLVEGEKAIEIPAETAKAGNILLVKPGGRIPLDGVVVEGESRLDTSPITGEPVPVRAAVGDKVISGCINTSGALKIRVEKTLENSMVTRILDSVENAAASKPKIDKFITRFARIYTPFVVILAALTAVVPSLITGNWEHWIYTALTFLVISCPCALVLSVPLAFFSGIGTGSKKGILFKGGVALEALKDVKVVVMDKTGTITKGDFSVQNVIYSGELISLMTAGAMERPQGVSKNQVEDYLLFIAASCESASTHPIGISIVETAKARGIDLENPRHMEELAGKGIKATMSRGVVLCGNRTLMMEEAVDLTGYANPIFGSEVLVAINGKFVGSLTISDTIKKDSAAAIGKLKKQGLVTAMLTGDSIEGAEAVAKETGIEKTFAKLLPDDKLRILREIRSQHGSVMFVGDGINDAPVLAGADVGGAMGSGADAAIEAADVVFMTSGLEAVPEAIAIAKITSRIAMQNVVFALGIKAVVMILGLAGIASMWMAVFADSGVAMLCVMNAIRILYKKA